MRPKVSIYCITYNHASFIRQALDSFVMQQTNFPFEVIIGDDCSTDGTTQIIREYAEKYPDIIKPIYHKKNVGIDQNSYDVRQAISGQYVAMCEGDDYWTDKNKLQKQVDFLEKHPDCTVCFHPVCVKWEDYSQKDSVFPTAKTRFHKKMLDVDDMLKRNFIQTNSVMYRWCLKGREELLPSHILPGDWFLHLLHAQNGKIGFLPDIMGVYRKHKNGIWNGANVTDEWFLRCGLPHIRFYEAVEKHFCVDKNDEKLSMLRKTVEAALRAGNIEFLNKLQNLYLPLLQQAFTAKGQNKSLKMQKRIKKLREVVYGLTAIILVLVIYIYVEAK